MDRIPSWLRAGIITGAFVAAPGFAAALLGVVDEAASWAAGETVALPDLSALRTALVALVAGALIGAINATWRYAQERLGRGNPPVYPSRARPARPVDDRGHGNAQEALVIVALVLIILFVGARLFGVR